MPGNNAGATGTVANRLEYERRISRVADYLSQNLSAQLTPEMLADVAASSPLHFHRVFKSFTGERLCNSIQRIRLETSAKSLPRYPTAKSRKSRSIVVLGHRPLFAHVKQAKNGYTGQNGSDETSSHERIMNVAVTTLPDFHVAYHER
jgi:hypothetical protein